jgi:UDP-N-acetylmuramoyl-L-alanyl-D-glutamate--2,6-diaminopimelate ligase
MKISELVERSGARPQAVSGDAEITSVVSDSRQASPGALFVCMPGNNLNSQGFIGSAVQGGAVAVLAFSLEGFEKAKSLGVCALWSPVGPSEDLEAEPFRDVVWRLAKEFHGNVTRKMLVAGVTGTNGKTTTCWVLRDMLASTGRRSAYIGTLGIQTPLQSRLLENTTPLPIEMNNLIAECAGDGADSLAMEVSSHALTEHRADGIEFDAAVFTNLTQDHLDFHGTMEEYENAKLRLFTELPKLSQKHFMAAINVDDPVGAQWFDRLRTSKLAYGIDSGVLKCHPVEVRVDGLILNFSYAGRNVQSESHLGGTFNVYNCLSAVAGFMALGFNVDQAAEALYHATPVPGRFEAVPNNKGIGIIVDYAHTPDALEKLLESTRKLEHKRVITVFGCGGDRDRSKRPKMARAASDLSDLTVVTSDNPRTEDPQAILDEVAGGLADNKEAVKIIDRREAVKYAVDHANPGDIVVIAGKGHENYQIIGRTKYPMDDRDLAREALG